MKVNIKKLCSDAIIPEFKTAGAGACDLHSVVDIIIEPRSTAIIKTGIAIEIPEGYAVLIKGRSGLAFKHNIWAFNGLIDCDYRGEFNVLLENKSEVPFVISKGDRIAQAFFTTYLSVSFNEVDELSNTDRGENWASSTGK